MSLLLLGVLLVLAGGAAALIAPASWVARIGAAGTIGGCALGLIPAIGVALGGATSSFRAAWSVPGGSFLVAIDPLSALFLIPILALSALAAIYGVGYFASGPGHPVARAPWFWSALLTTGMVLTVVAGNGVLFLMAWEGMSIASFFLVTHEDEKESVREAGWTYLIAAHIGTAFLLVLFVLLGGPAGSLDFDRIAAAGTAALSAPILFALALAGFGMKAGFVPLHVWLPEAHPAAPSPVSAVMSGVMIKTGIYGLLRVLTFLGTPPASFGWTLIVVGAASGIAGAVFVLAQSDLKRLLAYSSVENVGLIALGIGVGLTGLHADSPAIAIFGFGGALLHLLNHSINKGLLFLGAGAVARASGTRDLERLGGLMKRMPATSGSFLTGAAAISGLPPLNGFAGEFLIYVAAFRGATRLDPEDALPCLVALAGLALTGGLAAAGFTRAFGFVFLGRSRSEGAERATETGAAMRLPIFVLAGACVLLGLLSPWMTSALAPALVVATGTSARLVTGNLAAAAASLEIVVLVSTALITLTGGLWLLRRWLLAGREVASAETWGCGFASPSTRMQYTASSYAQPLTDLFAGLLLTRREVQRPEGVFPSRASFSTETPDLLRERVYGPAFAGAARGAGRLRWLQQGQVRLYVAYIAVTLLVLLLWNLR